jgi:hypothetical protein
MSESKYHERKPNQTNAPLADETVIAMEQLAAEAVESWLHSSGTVESTCLSGSCNNEYHARVRFEGRLRGPFDRVTTRTGIAWLETVYEDNRVLVTVCLKQPGR